MVWIVVLLIIAALIAYMILQHKTNKRFRERILRDKPRMDDTEYLTEMPSLNDEKDIYLALQIRTVCASLGKLPRECISPEMPIIDLFQAQCFILFDGIDLAEIVLLVEDQLEVEILEDSNSFPITDDDTVTTLTMKLIEYAHTHWQDKFKFPNIDKNIPKVD